MLKLTADRHKASRGLFVTAELLVWYTRSVFGHLRYDWYSCYVWYTSDVWYSNAFWHTRMIFGYFQYIWGRWTFGTVMLVTLFLHTTHHTWWVLLHLVHFITCDVWYTSWYITPISTPSCFLVHFWNTWMIFGHFQYFASRCYIWYSSDIWYSNTYTSNIVFAH